MHCDCLVGHLLDLVQTLLNCKVIYSERISGDITEEII